MKQRMLPVVKKILLWAAVILISCQIFDFSADTGTESEGISTKITTVVVRAVQTVAPDTAQATLRGADFFHFCHKIVRKTAHFGIYAVLAACTFLLAKSYRLRIRISCAISALYCFLFAGGDEIHQLFVSGRSGQFSDVLLDFCGAVCGICVVLLLRRVVILRKK